VAGKRKTSFVYRGLAPAERRKAMAIEKRKEQALSLLQCYY
jgi:hypothetical protein